MTERAIITTDALRKTYGRTVALRGLSLSVGEGELFGLLGVNGAGKSTLIRILCGLTPPDAGGARIAGYDLVREGRSIRPLINVSPQQTAVARNLTVRENLAFFAALYGLGGQEREARVAEVVQMFALEEVLDTRASALSGGYARRVSIAAALISRPQILFLDEPTLGLDVLARRELWRVILSLKGKMTILLTSHYLEEIEALCDRVAVLCRGDLIALGTVAQLREETGTASLEEAFVALSERAEAQRRQPAEKTDKREKGGTER